ncbi:hypothetical protein FRB94_000597 [Tulasnella sp. JGI-2019a]|nr:hypothetical protein FRB94_000597 [Tulasnella sp. JGI-2019a]
MVFAPELLSHILQTLSQLDNGRASIASVSAVCREWGDLASQVRWREADLPSLLSVLAPLRGWEKGKRFIPVPWAFERRLTRQDWARFDKVAQRVRILNVVYWIGLSESLLGTLECTRPESTFRILPRVQRLRNSHLLKAEQVYFLLPFLPSILSIFEARIQLESLNETCILEDLISLLPTRFPNLRVIEIGWGRHYRKTEIATKVTRALECAITRLPNLDTILFDKIPWSASVVSHLAHVPKLKRLVLFRSNGTIDSWAEQELMVAPGDLASAFSQLKSFKAEMNLAEVTPFLHGLAEDHSLDHLYLTVRSFRRLADHRNLTTLAKVIGRHCGLKRLSTTTRGADGSERDALRLLRACALLEALEITIIASTVGSGDADVGSILEKMRRLRELKLDIATDRPLPLTLQSLVFVVQFCPDLEDVTIIVDTMSVDPNTTIPFPPTHKKLRKLCMAECNTYPDRVSQISSLKSIAAFSSQLTECDLVLSKFRVGEEEIKDDEEDNKNSEAMRRHWNGVTDLVPWFQKVRRNAIIS